MNSYSYIWRNLKEVSHVYPWNLYAAAGNPMHMGECEAERTNEEAPSLAGKQGLGWEGNVLKKLPDRCQALGYSNIYHNL